MRPHSLGLPAFRPLTRTNAPPEVGGAFAVVLIRCRIRDRRPSWHGPGPIASLITGKLVRPVLRSVIVIENYDYVVYDLENDDVTVTFWSALN